MVDVALYTTGGGLDKYQIAGVESVPLRHSSTARENNMERYLKETQLLDFSHPALTELVRNRGWTALSEYERIAKTYDFVQNEIAFGYNEADDIPASQVYRDGYGQCNTKGTLLMALLRMCGLACRFHAFTIGKQLQKGAISGLAYNLAPRNIIHSWVEVWFENKWVNLEGFILDRNYLKSVQDRFSTIEGAFCGYAIATHSLKNPSIEWNGTDTYIQKDGINHDYGVFNAPDDFYENYGANLTGIKRVLFRHIVRKWMNNNVSRIRRREW
jgi:transglutaminase-like putative cysteine protease